MPLSIVNIPAIIASGNAIASYKFTQDAILVGAEAYDNTNTCDIVMYLKTSGAVQSCGIPVSHVGPQKVVSEDIKIPVSGKEELVADFYGVGANDACWLKLMFYQNGGSQLQRAGWWQ